MWNILIDYVHIMENIAQLLKEKEFLTLKLSILNYGSIEIRNKQNKPYVYIHYRSNNKQYTKYLGSYSKQLENQIIESNKLAKIYKQRINEINKILFSLEYVTSDLSYQTKLNIDLARRNLVDSIYKQAMLEGVVTTYSDTEAIINGGIAKNMTVSDINKVVNLKRAWEFILSEGVISSKSNYYLLCQINGLVEQGFSYSAGKLRSIPVKIGGSNYIPPIPFDTIIKEELNKILNSKKNVIDKTIDIVLYVMKKQLFLDGNKRTAIIFANHYLISHSNGLIVIPSELVDVYKKLLIDYYEDKDSNKIKEFLLNKCWIKIK